MPLSPQEFEAIAAKDQQSPWFKFWLTTVRPAFNAAVNAQTPRDRYHLKETYRRSIGRMTAIRCFETAKTRGVPFN